MGYLEHFDRSLKLNGNGMLLLSSKRVNGDMKLDWALFGMTDFKVLFTFGAN